MSDPVALLYGALACWLLAGVAIRIGWDATFQPGAMWHAWICIPLACILLALSIVLGIVGFAGLLRGS